ncbi:MAG: DEAD/DEAH box helicase [Ruthenibacterium sp.]
MPLSRAYLYGLCDVPQTYFKGASYYAEKRVNILSNRQLSNGTRMLHAGICGTGGMRHQTSILLSADGDALVSYTCTCAAFASYSGVCKHIIAMALAVDDLAPAPTATPLKSDSLAVDLLRDYAQQSMQEVFTPVSDVMLVPTLDLSANVPCVRFKIGRERMYIVKDVLQFVNAVQTGAEISYGKNFSFSHTLGAFCAESVPLINFLRTYFDSNNRIYAGSYFSYYGSSKGRDMYLPPFMFEAFLSLYEGGNVPMNGSSITDCYTIKAENPRLPLHIDLQKNGSYALYFSDDFQPFEGSTCLYLVLNKTIYKCEASYSNATRKLFGTLAKAREHRLTVAACDMPALAATLLPTLTPYLSIASDSDLAAFAPPALHSKVYFDLPEPETVTARLEHYYDNQMHLGFGRKDVRQSLDLNAEMQTERVLLHYLKESKTPGTVSICGDEKALYELAEHGTREIAQFAEIFVTDAFKTMRVKPPASVNVGVRVESDLLRLHFDVQGVDLAELAQVLDSYRKAKKYHRLRDGSFLNLEDSALQEFSELAQGLDLSSREMMSSALSVPKYRALYLDALLKQSERMQYDRDGAFKQIVRDMRDVSDADYEIPESLRPVLRNYQKTGYRWLRTIAAYGFGGILADDMGLGKTLQVIALLLAQKETQAAHSLSLVICPSSLVLNWESEVQKFAPSLRVAAVTGTLAARGALIAQENGAVDLFVTSYDLLRRDVELYAKRSFQYVIADEAQYLKNQNTQNAKAVKMLPAAVRLALTGTPVENSLAEVWSIFDFLMPGYLYHYAKFRKRFELPIVKQSDEGAAKSLRKMVSPFILRRMKTDVLKELPDKIETVLYAEFEDEQKKIYLANAAAAKKELEAGLGDSGTDKLQILALLTRLRQICCDPALVYENYTQTSAKLELCMELLQRCGESGHRVLLFSQFTSMLTRIANRLDAAQIPYYTITGATKSSDRLALVNDFNAGNTPVFLISLKAGGTGLNLTGADVVIHYDPWWNSSAQNQASDRAHRIGQTKTVQVYKLIAKNTLEERILEMQKSKADLADMIVREGDGAFARMSKNDILALFDA